MSSSSTDKRLIPGQGNVEVDEADTIATYHCLVIIATAAVVVTVLMIFTFAVWLHACLYGYLGEREKRRDDGGWFHC